MKTTIDKKDENKSQVAANNLTAQKSNSNAMFQFVDNRPEAILQRKLQEMANNYVSNQKQPIQLMNETYKNQPLITNYFGRRTNATDPNDHNQPLITNYFGVLTNSTFEQTNLPYNINQDQIEIEGNDNDFSAIVSGLGDIGELELFEDTSGKKWINQIHVHSRAKRKGIGTALLQKAIAAHGVIYASTQPADEDEGNDTRHLTDEGELLVNACIGKGMSIIKTYPGMEVEDEGE